MTFMMRTPRCVKVDGRAAPNTSFRAVPSLRSDCRGAASRYDQGKVTSSSRARNRRRESAWARITSKRGRDLIADISHDLRTPLVAMRGYLELLVARGDSSRAEDRQRYAAIALRQSEHLASLVDDLFELAKLDSEGLVLDARTLRRRRAGERRDPEVRPGLGDARRSHDGRRGCGPAARRR
jgi:signal transduction histidine kinase